MTKNGNMQSVIAWLSRALHMSAEVDALIERGQRCYDRATRITTIFSPVVVAGTREHDRLESAIAKLMDLSNEMSARVDQYIATEQEIRSVIEEVDNEQYCKLLTSRYLNGRKWERIAEDLGIEPRSVYYAHGRALQKVAEILEQRLIEFQYGSVV